MNKLYVTILSLISFCIALLAIYGGSQLYSCTDRHQQLDDYRFEINHLQAKALHLRRLNDYIPAMEQILDAEQLADLKAATEMIWQKKYREYERWEQPLLNEEERKDR